MARGWESKSVESQKDDADTRAERLSPLTAEERARKARIEGLELSRRRVLHDLETATSAARRASLEQALFFLDREIEKLDGPAGP
jgi:CHASE3 domain sensor protein